MQKAQWMTLMTQGISAQRAYEIGLVDDEVLDSGQTLYLDPFYESVDAPGAGHRLDAHGEVSFGAQSPRLVERGMPLTE